MNLVCVPEVESRRLIDDVAHKRSSKQKETRKRMGVWSFWVHVAGQQFK